MLLVREVLAYPLKIGDAHRLEKFVYVGGDNRVVLHHASAHNVVDGDVLLVGAGPFARIAGCHHVHQTLQNIGRRFLRRTFK